MLVTSFIPAFRVEQEIASQANNGIKSGVNLLKGKNNNTPVPTKNNGGVDASDFANKHSQKHMYDSTKPSTSNKTQYGKDVDDGQLRKDTVNNPNEAYSNWPNPINQNPSRVTKYEKEYGGNISTSDTRTKHHRVFINVDNPNRSTHFPYVNRPK